MRKINSNHLLCAVVAFCLISSFAVARSYVVPTWYGYGMVQRGSPVLRPYLVPTYYSGNPYFYGPFPFDTYGFYSPAYYGNTDYYYYYNYPYGQTTGWAPVYGWVKNNRLNLRSGPGRNTKSIGTLVYGERLWIYGKSGNWYFVRSINRPGTNGYVHSDYVTLGYPYYSSPDVANIPSYYVK